MSLSGSLEKYQQFLHDQPIMQNQKGIPKAQSCQAPEKSGLFLHGVLLEFSGSPSRVLSLDPTPACSDHLQDLGMLGVKLFAHM